MEAKLDGEKVYWLTKLAILEYLTTGCTAAFDMYFELDDYVKACIESGFRSVLCGAVSGDKSNLERLENNYLKYNGKDPLISFMLGFHAGMTPTELFDSFGIFDFGGAGFHCVHMSDKDLEIFKNKGVWAVHCAGSNVKLASGIAPIVKMQDMGINIAIGTDGPASNNCLDMFREMFLMTGLQKIACDDASACPADSVLKAATVGSARAMGLSDCDIIAEGKQADLIVIDLFQPNMQPLNNIGKNLVYSGSKQNVKLTMCAGKVLYEDGEFRIGEEPAVIYKKANEIIESMKY
jgi:5-methylthioadenosine/S-adenosylhomocysteine deaminase